jgi:hypothetical protein
MNYAHFNNFLRVRLKCRERGEGGAVVLDTFFNDIDVVIDH